MKKSLVLLAVAGSFVLSLHGQLIVNEEFTDLSGWTDTTGGNWSVGSNLDYAGWASSGNAASELTNATGDRLENAAILGANTIVDGTTYWGGFLMENAAASTANRSWGFYETGFGALRLVFNTDASNNIILGTRDAAGDPGTGNLSSGTAQAMGTGTTNLVLFRIDAKTGNDDVYAWFNPNLSLGEPNVATATWTSVGLDDFATTTNMAGFRFSASNSQQLTVDELRVGTEFTAVIPEPSACALLAGSIGFAWILLRRRA